MRRRLEGRAVDLQRLHHLAGREMRGEGIGQPQRRRQLRAEGGRAEDPDRHVRPLTRRRLHRRARRGRAQIGHQFQHVVGKPVLAADQRAPQRLRGGIVAPRRPAQPQIDAAGEQRVERAELLGDHQRRMVRQHHPAGADADGAGAAGNMRHHHRGGGTGDAGDVVMLGQPEPAIACGFGGTGKVKAVGQRLRSGTAFEDRAEVKDRKGIIPRT